MIRITGMNSGLDTDSIIKELIKAKSDKLNTLKKSKTKLEWKQDAWKTTNSKIYNFYSKQLSNLRFQSSFKKKATKVSNENVASVVAGDNAVNGSQSLVVTQLAKAGYLTGGKLSEDKSVNSGSKLNEALGAGIDGTATIDVKVGNKVKSFSIDGETTVSQFVSKLNESGVNASFDAANQRIFVNTAKSGEGNDFEITAANADGLKALSSLGLLTNDDITGNKEYQSLKNYYDADDSTILANLEADGKIASYAAAKANNLQNSLTALQKTINDTQKSVADKQEELDKAREDEKYAAVSGDTLEEKRTNAAARLEDAQKAMTENSEKLEYIDLASKDSAELTEEQKTRLTELESKYELASLDKEALLEEQTSLKEELTAAKADVAAVKKVSDLEASVMELQTKTYDTYSKMHDTALALNEYYSSIPEADRTEEMNAAIEKNNEVISAAETFATTYETLKGGAVDEYKLADTPSYNIIEQSRQEMLDRVKTANEALSNAGSITSSSAVRVKGQDARIILNGAEFESTSNSFTINGLTITAKQVSGISGYEDDTDAEGNAIKKPIYEEVSINTEDDITGVYNMIKDFLKEYNAMIKELDSAYNAPSAKGYEPLTDDEKEAMSDKEIEEWEKKVKDALLRQDSDLGSVISSVKSNMLSTFEINGQKYTLSSFGIETLGYFNSEENERGMYHIDGDPNDGITSGNTDKLKKMIASDPDVVSSFFSQLANKVYDDLTVKMKTTEYSSIYTVYEDKKMKTDISDYKTKIDEAQKKLNAIEDKYYKQFSAMETAIGKLNSQQSSLSSMLGMG